MWASSWELWDHHLLWGLASSQGRGILIECSFVLCSQHKEDLPWLPSLGACPPSSVRPRSPFLNAVPVPASLNQKYKPAGCRVHFLAWGRTVIGLG